MGSADITSAGGADALTQIPTTLGVIAVAYNLSGVTKLQLDGPALANIYLGNIKKWNDPALVALNPGVTLPNGDIQVVHRSDSSGTSYHFTDYLAKVSDTWKSKVGVGKAVSWPAGIGGNGNQGRPNPARRVRGRVRKTRSSMRKSWMRRPVGELRG